MKQKSSKIIYAVFMVLFVIIVTALGRYIGISLYQKNVNDAVQELVDVEVTDIIEDIKYGLELGKDMKSFYGMDDTLKSEIRTHDHVTDFYILDSDYDLLYRTSNDEMPEEIESLEYGIIEKGNIFYSSRRINEEYILVTVSNTSLIKEIRGDSISDITRIAFIGCPIVILIMLIAMFVIKDEKKCWIAILIIVGSWIFGLSLYNCIINYNNYSKSIDRVEQTVVNSFKNDMAYLKDKGVDMQYVGEIEEYMHAYTDHIDGIDDIVVNRAGDLQFIYLPSARSSVVFKYILQMLLMITFMFIVLWEVRIFMTENKNKRRRA